MTSERNATTSVVLSFLLVLGTASGGLAAMTGGVAAEHGSPGNYTVHLPDQSDHHTGDTNGASASIWHLAGLTDGFEDTSSKDGFEKASFLTIGSDDIDFSNCGTSNTAAFGIDRGNDDGGTVTDDDLLRHREDSQFNKHGIVVDFFDGDDFGETVSINDEDQIVAVQNDCYKMPSEPGWYQISGSLNGTGYDDSEFEIQLTSHYFYICDCESEEEARQQLGPPPSEESSSESTPTPTPEPEQSTATPTPEPEQSTATATAASTATATGEQGESTPTATPVSDDDQSTSTAEPQQDDQQDQQQQDDEQQQATATAPANDSAPATPTVAEGPGFGAGLALAALAGAALVALRRSQ